MFYKTLQNFTRLYKKKHLYNTSQNFTTQKLVQNFTIHYNYVHKFTQLYKLYTTLHNSTNKSTKFNTQFTFFTNKIHNFATFYKQLSQTHKHFTAHDKQKPYTTLHIFYKYLQHFTQQTIQHNFTKPSKKKTFTTSQILTNKLETNFKFFLKKNYTTLRKSTKYTTS